MPNYKLDTYNPFFPHQKEPVYDPNDPVSLRKFNEYWKQEKERCMYGFSIADGQVKIPGRIYWHCVYWKIAAYREKRIAGKKRKIREIITPLLRDVDWDVFNDIERATEEGRFYNLVGSRDWGKSIIAASCSGWLYTFFDNSESVISGGAENYIKLATDKIQDGLGNMHPIFKKQRLSTDWRKEIRAGWKDKNTNQPHERSSNSRILVRNYEDGNKSMAANGTRPGFHLIDEIGTIRNLISCIKDSDGCWWSGGGDKPSCLVFTTGTGGDMERGAEAAEVFYTPIGYNMLEFDDVWEHRGKIGRFIPATRAKEAFRDPRTLGEYLGISHPDLDAITILVADEQRAKEEWWDIEYEKARKSGNPKTVLKFKAYWPLVPSDSFLTLSTNNYNVEAAKKQQNKLKAEGITGTPVFLHHDGERVKHVFTDMLPITEFPLKTQSSNAPIMIWEHPPEYPPWGLYLAGVDPYRQDSAQYSDSLGAIYIYKRMHEITGELYQDMFVAAYVARPKSVDEWCEQARLLIKYYNAFTLCENDDMTFIRYMQNKGDGHMLCDQPAWLSEIVPGSTLLNKPRAKGIHRSSEKVRVFLRTCLKRYLDETILKEEDENGSVIKELLGVSRILDPMLLEEIIKFNDDINVDREVAASLAIALANKMAPLGAVNSLSSDPRYQSLFNRNKIVKGGLFTRATNALDRGTQRKRYNTLFK